MVTYIKYLLAITEYLHTEEIQKIINFSRTKKEMLILSWFKCCAGRIPFPPLPPHPLPPHDEDLLR